MTRTALILAVILASTSGGCGGLRAVPDTGGPDAGKPPGTTSAAFDAGRGDAVPDSASSAVPDADLVLRYRFDEVASSTVVDSASWQNVERDGTLVSDGSGTAWFSDDRRVGTHSLSLTAGGASAGGYVLALGSPGLRDIAPGAVTVAVWVLVGEDRFWQRVFDFGALSGSVPDRYMFLTTSRPGSVTTNVRFAISQLGFGGEQTIDGRALTIGTWHHIAVVLPEGSPYTGRLYVDGALQGVNAAMTLHPRDLGATDQNALGRSLYPDPTYVGNLDDFRVYRRALSDEEIVRLVDLR